MKNLSQKNIAERLKKLLNALKKLTSKEQASSSDASSQGQTLDERLKKSLEHPLTKMGNSKSGFATQITGYPRPPTSIDDRARRLVKEMNITAEDRKVFDQMAQEMVYSLNETVTKKSETRIENQNVAHSLNKSAIKKPETKIENEEEQLTDDFPIYQKKGTGVQCLFYTVIIKYSAVETKYPGGFAALCKANEDNLETDGELISYVTMGTGQEEFMEDLMKHGLVCNKKEADFYLFYEDELRREIPLEKLPELLLTYGDGAIEFFYRGEGEAKRIWVKLKHSNHNNSL